METSRDFVLDCMATITQIAKAVGRAWPEGSSMRMHQDDTDVVLRNKEEQIQQEEHSFGIASSFILFDQEVMTPPVVLVESQSADFLGYSAEFESTVDYEYNEFPSELAININVTSAFKALNVRGKDFTLQYSVPLSETDLTSSRELILSHTEEVIIREGGNVTIVSVSSTTKCKARSNLDRRLATDKLNGCKILHIDGRTRSCDCNHVDDVTVFIKVWKIGISGIFRWSISISCVVSFIAITIAVAILGYARCLWKGDEDLFRTMVLVTIAATDMCLLLSVQEIESEIFCKANAIVLHFSYLSISAWMFVRGSLLLRQSHKPLHGATESLPRRRIGFLIGLGVPSVVVFISGATSVSQYTSEFGCLADFKALLWVFLLPAIIVSSVSIGTFFFVAFSWLLSIYKISSFLSFPYPKRNDLQRFALTAVLAVAAVVLMPSSLATPTGKVTANEWLFVVVNSLLGPCVLSLSCFTDSKVRKALALRVGQNKKRTDNLSVSAQKDSSEGIPKDRGASYIDVDFTPVIPWHGASNHRPDSPIVSADNDGFEGCPEINLRALACSTPTPPPSMRPDSSMSELDLELLPGMVLMDEPKLVKEVKTSHRVFVRGSWHVEEEKVVRKVYRRPRSSRETSTV
ncbi:latrophilin Cirl-like [Patiria miniata]|uniref:G-protein coupled receptors family 2 profile 2 domain-containing protein n=1 Tax=Patiria miniata TaxID=46514 RepID=A0A913ZYB6_PATMI|nr:latrophilin Cirl-like [Patiria miniata]